MPFPPSSLIYHIISYLFFCKTDTACKYCHSQNSNDRYGFRRNFCKLVILAGIFIEAAMIFINYPEIGIKFMAVSGFFLLFVWGFGDIAGVLVYQRKKLGQIFLIIGYMIQLSHNQNPEYSFSGYSRADIQSYLNQPVLSPPCKPFAAGRKSYEWGNKTSFKIWFAMCFEGYFDFCSDCAGGAAVVPLYV